MPTNPVLRVPRQFKTIQDAVNAAVPGSIIEIDPGEYKPDFSIVIRDKNLLLRSTDAEVRILGRKTTLYHDATLVVIERSEVRFEGIILDGAKAARVISITDGRLELSNCSVINGKAWTGLLYAAYGGNIEARRSGVLLQLCQVSKGLVDNFPGTLTWTFGAGISLRDHCTALLERCVVSGNLNNNGNPGAWMQGGGIYCEDSTLFTVGCKFDRNRCVGVGKVEGGGIYLRYSYASRIERCAFTNNEAKDGGAIFIWPRESSITLIDNTFSGNVKNDIAPPALVGSLPSASKPKKRTLGRRAPTGR